MPAPTRYNRFAALLHWTMAAALIAMLAMGLVMTNIELEKSLTFQLYQWHKSVGVLLLVAFFMRIIWRQISAVPPLPDAFSKREKQLAKLGHAALYAAMLAMPITGWVIVSTSVYGLPTIVFGWFEWPHIPGMHGDTALHDVAEGAHFIIALLFISLIIGHIAVVIHHKRKDGIRLLPRMRIGKA